MIRRNNLLVKSMLVMLDTFSLSSLSSLSHLKLTPSKGLFPPPPELNSGPLAHQSLSHACDAARAAILYVYRRCIDDVVGLYRPCINDTDIDFLKTFPTVVFCEIQWGYS